MLLNIFQAIEIFAFVSTTILLTDTLCYYVYLTYPLNNEKYFIPS